MHIDGSHMNYAYQLQQENGYGIQGQGRHGNRRALGHLKSPAKNGLNNANVRAQEAGTKSMSLGDVFAQEMIRRMDPVTDETGQAKDTSALKSSLASTMDWVRGRFGDETGAAAAGMILQATSSGVTEDTLGDGLLNVLKFIDRNFGTQAGDQAISRFNSGINQALNQYFENGFDEVFFAVEPGQTAGDVAQAVVADQASDSETVDPAQLLLDSITSDLENYEVFASLAEELKAGEARTSDVAGFMAQYMSQHMAATQAEPQVLNAMV